MLSIRGALVAVGASVIILVTATWPTLRVLDRLHRPEPPTLAVPVDHPP